MTKRQLGTLPRREPKVQPRQKDTGLSAVHAKHEAERVERQAIKDGFKAERRAARRAELCAAEVRIRPTSPTSTKRRYWKDDGKFEEEDGKPYKNKVEQYRDDETHSGSSRPLRTICCKPVLPGKKQCGRHYVRDVLHVSSKGHATGGHYRPFKDWQVPLGEMSDIQEELLKRLPLVTPYEDCIAAMNAVDSDHPLKPIYEQPGKTPRRPRVPKSG